MRLYVALLHRDGRAEIVNASRPASLVAFSDEHEGKEAPENAREMAWLVHHALGVEQPLDDWLAEVEDLSPAVTALVGSGSASSPFAEPGP